MLDKNGGRADDRERMMTSEELTERCAGLHEAVRIRLGGEESTSSATVLDFSRELSSMG